MPRITRRLEFSAGHTLHGHPGKCANLHGHNYVAMITVAADDLDDQGMVLDFGVVKEAADRVIDRELDHLFLVYDKDPRAGPLRELDPTVRVVPFNPTAENIARYLKQRFDDELGHHQATVCRVQLWETETCHAEV